MMSAPLSNSQTNTPIKTDLEALKGTVGDNPTKVDVVVNTGGRNYKVTFYNVTKGNFDQKVTEYEIAYIMQNAVQELGKGDKYKSIDFKTDRVVLHKNAGGIKEKALVSKDEKLDALEKLSQLLNTPGNQKIKKRFDNKTLTAEDVENLKRQLSSNLSPSQRNFIDKYLKPTTSINSQSITEKIQKLNASILKGNSVYHSIIGPIHSSSSSTSPHPSTASVSTSSPLPSTPPVPENVRKIRDLINNYENSDNKDENLEDIVEAACQLSDEEIESLTETELSFLNDKFKQTDFYKDNQNEREVIDTIRRLSKN